MLDGFNVEICLGQVSVVAIFKPPYLANPLRNESESESRSVLSNSLPPHGLYIYSPWKSPDQNTEMESRSLLQGIFPTQGLNPGLPHCRRFFTS